MLVLIVFIAPIRRSLVAKEPSQRESEQYAWLDRLRGLTKMCRLGPCCAPPSPIRGNRIKIARVNWGELRVWMPRLRLRTLMISVALVSILAAIPNWSGQNRKYRELAEKYKQIELITRERKDRLDHGGEYFFSPSGRYCILKPGQSSAGFAKDPDFQPTREKFGEYLDTIIAEFSALSEKYTRARWFPFLPVDPEPEIEWSDILNQ